MDPFTVGTVGRVLGRRRRPAAWGFALTLVVSILATALTPPTYEADASVVLFHENDAIVALVQGHDFAERAVARAGLGGPLGDNNLSRAASELQAHMKIRPQVQRIGKIDRDILQFEGEAPTAALSVQFVDAYLGELRGSRTILENITFQRLWEAHLADTDGNATAAAASLRNLTRDLSYFEVLAAPTLPAGPSTPHWRLNLFLAVAGAVVIGAMSAAVAETLAARRP